MINKITILLLIALCSLGCEKEAFELPTIENPDSIPELFTPDKPYMIKYNETLIISPAVRYSDMNNLSYEWRIEAETVSQEKTLKWLCNVHEGTLDAVLIIRMKKNHLLKEFPFTIIVKDVDAPVFNEDRYIHFDSPNDVYELLYSFEPANVEYATISLPISYKGVYYDSDKTFSLAVCKEKTTAIENEDFILPDQPVFHSSGMYHDVVSITLNRTDRVREKDLKLCIQLIEDEHFIPSGAAATAFTINISNAIRRPEWWNNDVEEFYLGKYSEKKYTLFYRNVYSGDFGLLDSTEKYLHTIAFKTWIDQHPDEAVEEDGSPMRLA